VARAKAPAPPRRGGKEASERRNVLHSYIGKAKGSTGKKSLVGDVQPCPRVHSSEPSMLFLMMKFGGVRGVRKKKKKGRGSQNAWVFGRGRGWRDVKDGWGSDIEDWRGGNGVHNVSGRNRTTNTSSRWTNKNLRGGTTRAASWRKSEPFDKKKKRLSFLSASPRGGESTQFTGTERKKEGVVFSLVDGVRGPPRRTRETSPFAPEKRGE